MDRGQFFWSTCGVSLCRDTRRSRSHSCASRSHEARSTSLREFCAMRSHSRACFSYSSELSAIHNDRPNWAALEIKIGRHLRQRHWPLLKFYCAILESWFGQVATAIRRLFGHGDTQVLNGAGADARRIALPLAVYLYDLGGYQFANRIGAVYQTEQFKGGFVGNS